MTQRTAFTGIHSPASMHGSLTGAPTGHAVVVGGSMGGLLAARVLADHFAQVTVVDRDHFLERPDHRNGVPQSRHAHALLARGQQILEKLFPGIAADLLADGAIPARQMPVFVTPVGTLAKPRGDRAAAPGFYASRVLLEWHVRHRLAALPGVSLRPRMEVTALIGTDDGDRVVGIMLRPRDEPAAEETLFADLVVDASGRGSVAPAWLQALGYPAVPEETVHSGIGYASRLYRPPSGFPGEWGGIVVNGRPPHNPRAGLILPIEGGLWHVSLGGFAGHHPPTDEPGFLDWARHLPDPTLYEAIQHAEPVSPIRGYRTPSNRLRRFDKLPRWPEGFVAVGDAVCAFNPIYGQGMTVAAMGAELLGKALDRQAVTPAPHFARRFQRALAKAVAAPWLIASGEDLRWGVPATGTKPAPGSGVVRRYVERVLWLARTDPAVSAAYQAVVGMVAPPASLFAPRVLLPVLAEAAMGLFRPTVEAAETSALPPAAPAHRQTPTVVVTQRAA